jgi:betaine reductase
MSVTNPHRVVMYLNQFFAGKGGEDTAGIAPFKVEGCVGPGRLLEQTAQGAFKIAGTVVCGDNYFVEKPEALKEVIGLISSYQPEALIAGPAFLAGRYGEACAEICLAVQQQLCIPVITGLAPEHPALERYRKDIPIYQTGKNAADMKNSLPRMGAILLKGLEGIELSPDDRDALFKRGLKKNVVLEQTAAERAIRMLLAKHRGEKWQSELPIPRNETVKPAPPVTGKGFRVALITDGGLMLKGNPERMPSGRCKRWYRINIESLSKLTPAEVDVNHFGYDNRYVAADPNRLVPLDVMRDLEARGEVRLHPIIYSTAGAATAIENAASFGREIALELKNSEVRAAILTST